MGRTPRSLLKDKFLGFLPVEFFRERKDFRRKCLVYTSFGIVFTAGES
jgi:hypothetical protein